MLRHRHMFSGYSNVRRDYSGLWHEACGLWFYTGALNSRRCDSVTHSLEYDTSPKVSDETLIYRVGCFNMSETEHWQLREAVLWHS